MALLFVLSIAVGLCLAVIVASTGDDPQDWREIAKLEAHFNLNSSTALGPAGDYL